MKTKMNQKLDYFMVIFSIILSGSVLPYAFFSGYSRLLIMLLLLIISFYFFKIKQIKINLKILIIFLMLVSLTLFLNFIKKEFLFIKEYLGLIIRMIVAFLITSQIKKEKFILCYTNFIKYLAYSSLIFYVMGFMPNFFKSLPIIFDDVRTGFRYAYIYVYQGVEIWNFRNAGIFWEAGAFQVFLNIALFFKLYYYKEGFSRDVIILIITIITTISTIGFIVLGMVLFYELIRKKGLEKYILIPAAVIMMWFLNIFNSIYEKIFMSNVSRNDRMAGQIADLILFSKSPVLGVGYSRYLSEFKKIALSLGAKAPNSSNSFTLVLALNGLIYFFISFLLFYLFFYSLTKDKIEKLIMSLSFFVMLSTEGFSTKLIFFIFIFYGIKTLKTKNILKEKINKKRKGEI